LRLFLPVFAVKADTLFVSYNNSADTIEKYTTAGICRG